MFSIIICTYNGERTIKKAIEKILCQENYDKYVEQFIIVDNASNDSTKDIIYEYAENNNIIYSYEKKSGLGYARLNGIKIASAEWVVFVDDDNELDCNWIKTAAEYIKDNPDISIFGGNVIPKTEFRITNEESERLSKYYEMLACTSFKRDDIDYTLSQVRNGIVIGAGMVVKTKYLKELAKRGWINQMGRVKNNTAAGDDGEISFFITNVKHEKSGFCPNLIIEHNIPKERLQEEYLLRLRRDLVVGSYNLQSMKKWYVLRRIKGIVKILFNSSHRGEKEFDRKMNEMSKKLYLKLVWQDKLVFKKKR